MSSPKEYHFDAVYPVPLSRLRGSSAICAEPSAYRRAVKKQTHRGSSGRFRTQPITFQEIKEVDEEAIGDAGIVKEPKKNANTEAMAKGASSSRSEKDLKRNFELFYRSINLNDNDNTADGSTSTSNHQCNSYNREFTSNSSSSIPIAYNPKSRPSL